MGSAILWARWAVPSEGQGFPLHSDKWPRLHCAMGERAGPLQARRGGRLGEKPRAPAAWTAEWGGRGGRASAENREAVRLRLQ